MSDERKTYTVTATRSDQWWALECPEVRGFASQARRLDQAEAMAREAIGLLLDVPEDSFDVTVITDLGEDELTDQVAEVRELRVQADQFQKLARLATAETVASVLARRIPMRDASAMLGVSHQRIQQLARDWKVITQPTEHTIGKMRKNLDEISGAPTAGRLHAAARQLAAAGGAAATVKDMQRQRARIVETAQGAFKTMSKDHDLVREMIARLVVTPEPPRGPVVRRRSTAKERLLELQDLLQSGLITPEEYQAKRGEVLQQL
jgi:predicted RNase H-like HicB family nuclease